MESEDEDFFSFVFLYDHGMGPDRVKVLRAALECEAGEPKSPE